MGARKRNTSEKRKDWKSSITMAKLNNCPTSPRKMRLVADLVRGKGVNVALDILKYCPKEAANRVEKLVLSAISNWQKKNEDMRLEDSQLFVKEIFVDGGRMLKRVNPAPQGRAYRKRKRSNHVTLILDSMLPVVEQEEEEEEEVIDESSETENQTTN